jgi:hypothetical protein
LTCRIERHETTKTENTKDEAQRGSWTGRFPPPGAPLSDEQAPAASTARYTITHLDPSGALNNRFHFAFFESGHMLYLKDSVRAQAKQALEKFIQTTAAAAAATTTSQ